MSKQVRAFNLDSEIGAAIDAEAGTDGNRSALVNALLKEALDARFKQRKLVKTVAQFGEATSSLMVTVLVLGLFLALI